jgi:hypothetical protein
VTERLREKLARLLGLKNFEREELALAFAMGTHGRLGAGSWEILAHRAVWGTLVAWVFVLLARQGGQVAEVLRSPRRLAALALSALLIGSTRLR